MSAKDEAVRFVLESHLMFGGLTAADKASLAPLFEVRQFREGDVIAIQHEPIEGMYVVYSGEVRLKESKSGKRLSLGEMGSDSTLGEMSFIQDQQWPYYVTASTDVTMLVLPAAKVRPLIRQSAEMGKVFKTQVGLVELGQRLRGILGTAKYKPAQFSEILNKIGVKKAKKGKTVYKQDQEDPRLYYIEHGSVDLVRTLISGESLTLDRVGDRELIGEGAALPDVGSGGRHEHTAMAVTETTVLVINAEEVQKILTINPELHERLRVRYNSLKVREEEEADIQNRAEGVDQRIKLSDAITEDEYRATIGAKKIDKFPHVAQGDESDNPAACLTAIVQHYGKQFALGQLREITNLGVEGAAPNALITAAEILGLRAKAYGLNFEELKKAQLPVICGWEGYHWIVIFKIDGKNVYLTDPAAGLGSIPIDEFLEGWTTADVSGVEERDPDKGVVIGIDTTVEFTRLEPP